MLGRDTSFFLSVLLSGFPLAKNFDSIFLKCFYFGKLVTCSFIIQLTLKTQGNTIYSLRFIFFLIKTPIYTWFILLVAGCLVVFPNSLYSPKGEKTRERNQEPRKKGPYTCNDIAVDLHELCYSDFQLWICKNGNGEGYILSKKYGQ